MSDCHPRISNNNPRIMSIEEIADIREDGTASLKEGIELTKDVAHTLAKHDGPV